MFDGVLISVDGVNILLLLLTLVELVGTWLGFLLEVELSILLCNTKQWYRASSWRSSFDVILKKKLIGENSIPLTFRVLRSSKNLAFLKKLNI